MGIESDQLVFDYLSRVGDLAQQQGLSSGSRMRLVAGLRARIDGEKPDTVPGVKRVLSRLGTPEAVVKAAGAGTEPDRPQSAEPRTVPLAPRPAEAPDGLPEPPKRSASGLAGGLVGGLVGGLTGKLPSPRDKSWDKSRGESSDKAENEPSGDGTPESTGRLKGLGKPLGLGKPIGPGKPKGPVEPPRTAASPPHLAGSDELGDGEDAPDWWRVDPAPFGPGETVPGFVGGIEIPEMWERPEDGDDEDGADGAGRLSLEKDGDADGADGAEADGAGARPLPGLLRRTLSRRRAAPVEEVAEPVEEEAAGPLPLRAWVSPVLGLAVLLLVAGAVTGSWIALGAGWLLAYVSRRLTRTEVKFGVLGVPGAVVAGLLVWLWGRTDGRWGEPIAQGKLGAELLGGLPGVARIAAVASAAFLVWRMRRGAGAG